MDDRPDIVVRLVAIVCLTVIVVTAIVGITLTAIHTDRDVRYAEGLSFAGAVLVALDSGLTLRGVRRRHRWRIEHDDNGES